MASLLSKSVAAKTLVCLLVIGFISCSSHSVDHGNSRGEKGWGGGREKVREDGFKRLHVGDWWEFIDLSHTATALIQATTTY